MSSIKFGDKEYALVPDRLKKFREDNPRGSVSTTFTFGEDGSLTFKAYILKDKADETSADATGTAFYTAKDMAKQKAFEKLETISVGRALSLLGYLNDGQIASSEEMEEFEDYKNQQKFEGIELAINQLESAESMEALKLTFTSLGNLIKEPSIVAAKDKRKAELSESKTATAK